MDNFLRSLFGWLCKPIYSIIPKLYSIFYSLAGARFFSEDSTVISDLSNNLYVLISVVMLFVFAANFLSAIVDPDRLTDNKKGSAKLVSRMVIGIVLIILMPFAFNQAYKIQDSIISNHLIEKLLVGLNFENDTDFNKGANGGQVIAGTLIGSVLYPYSDDVQVAADLQTAYENMVTTNISQYIGIVMNHVNIAPSNPGATEKYAFEFDYIVAIIAGIGVDYILLLFAMDMALRLFKMVFFELTAPISIIAYMATGNESLTRWGKEVGKTLVDVYIRIAAMALYVFLLSHLQEFLNNFEDIAWMSLLRVLLIVGMLIFAKQVPTIINAAFGTKLEDRGGISGRLGQMAAVGGVAQNAMKELQKHPIQSVRRVASTPVSAVGAGLAHNTAAINRGIGLFRDNAREGHAVRGALYGLGSAAGGLLTTGGAIARGANAGWTNGNLQGIGQAGKRYEDTHKSNSTFGGRVLDTLSSSVGIGTRLDRQGEEDKIIRFEGNRIQQVDSEEYNNTGSLLSQARTRLGYDNQNSVTVELLENRRKAVDSSAQRLANIADSTKEMVRRSDSNVHLRDLTIGSGPGSQTLSGNYAAQLAALNSMQANSSISADEIRAAQEQLEQNAKAEEDRVRNHIFAGGAQNTYISSSGGAAVELNATNYNDVMRERGIYEATVTETSNSTLTNNDVFKDARKDLSEVRNDIDMILGTHEQRLNTRATDRRQREMQASHDSVNARNGNGSGSSSGGSN